MLERRNVIARLAIPLALRSSLLLGSCGGGAAGGAALPAPAGAPASSLTATPGTGNAPLAVALAHVFLGGAAPQSANYTWEWDTDGDGDMDMITSGPGQPNMQLNFPQAGNFEVRLKVTGKDAGGNDYVINKKVTIEVK